MECGLCMRTLGRKRQATCIPCTRATLYRPRVENVAALLAREKSHSHAEAVIRPGNDGVIAALPEDADWEAITSGIKTHSKEHYSLELQQAEARIEQISSKAEELKRQIDECKNYIAKRKETNERRKKDLTQARKQLQNRMPGAVDPIRADCKKAGRALERTHTRTAEAREALCKEVAYLNGLTKTTNSSGREEYRLDGLPIPDLQDLNGTNGRLSMDTLAISPGTRPVTEHHEVISASMANVCRFIAVCCFYLDVRLPAEILLPHNDFPQPMILQERSSYRFNDLDYAALDISHTSDSASLLRRKSLPRPRLVQIDRPLTKLQQEDPKTYGLFVEGVMWLAWDIAWLCRSQGIDSINSFEEVCAIGKNLHTLFAIKEGVSRARPMPSRNTTATTIGKDDTKDFRPTETVAPRLGLLSHINSRYNLSGHAGARVRDDWRLESGSYHRLFDRLRNYLIDESRRAEWTFIDDREWDEELEHERPVLVGGSRRPTGGPAMSVMTVMGHEGFGENREEGGEDKNRNGWMKVRGRPTEG